ncbi:hypothetical protein HZS55_09810 [Halosimplex rubrum]|uniref:Uncharacterized protein n=1 Tax=Halosimplex rubrum TaxID=869889 RepID=A0A7D5TNS7_9EURY|nr:hypothetical protein [Halosimplex rubrum]QLH77574.1 hypothetical protein HZS55_09810 [Halosimplex rubrum]
MSTSNPLPTFGGRWDRLTYLLAAYKWLVSGLILGVIALVIYIRPSMPDFPPWVGAGLMAWVLLAFPCYLAGLLIVRWLRKWRYHTVYHINAVTDTREKWQVPPDIWDEKTVDGPPPYPVNDNQDFEVREFEWLEDIGELRVRGTWMGEASDSELVTSKSHMKSIHSYLLDAFEQLVEARALWHESSVELEQEIVNEHAEARERGLMVDQSAAKEVWENKVDGIEIDESDKPELSPEDLPDDHTPARPPENRSETNADSNSDTSNE